ncbi:Pyrophosphatase [Bacillus wiedmannii]|nr:Pyrophosphatase [Bacillus wiedmannii]
MNIVEFQRYVLNFSKEKGFQETTIEERTMYAMAELGELAEAILKREW